MSQFDEDLKSARHWLVDRSMAVTKTAFSYQDVANAAIHKAVTINECAMLPGDLPLRVRCFPNVFNLHC